MDNLILIKNHQAVTTSLVLAEKFGKRHDNVLQIIESIPCSEEFRLLNFKESFYITRDGFMLVAMGFTGAETDH